MKTELGVVMDIVDNDEKVRELFDKYYRIVKASSKELDGLSHDQTLALTAMSVAHLEHEYMTGLYVLCDADDVRFVNKVSDAVNRFFTGPVSRDLRTIKEASDARAVDE
jgi:hypothetical protein